MLPPASIKMSLQSFLESLCFLVIVISPQCDCGGILQELSGLSNDARNAISKKLNEIEVDYGVQLTSIEDNAVHRSRKLLSIPILNNRSDETLPTIRTMPILNNRSQESLPTLRAMPILNNRSQESLPAHRAMPILNNRSQESLPAHRAIPILNNRSKKLLPALRANESLRHRKKRKDKSVNIYIMDGKPPKIKNNVDTSDSSDSDDYHRGKHKKKPRSTTKRRNRTKSKKPRTTKSKKTRPTKSKKTRPTKSKKPGHNKPGESLPTDEGKSGPIESGESRYTEPGQKRPTDSEELGPTKKVHKTTRKYPVKIVQIFTAEPSEKKPYNENKDNKDDALDGTFYETSSNRPNTPTYIDEPAIAYTSDRNENNYQKDPTDIDDPSPYYPKDPAGVNDHAVPDSSERDKDYHPKDPEGSDDHGFPYTSERNENYYSKDPAGFDDHAFPYTSERNENYYTKDPTGFDDHAFPYTSERNENIDTDANINVEINNRNENKELNIHVNENNNIFDNVVTDKYDFNPNRPKKTSHMPHDYQEWTKVYSSPKTEKPPLDKIYDHAPETDDSEEILPYQTQLAEATPNPGWYVTPRNNGLKLKFGDSTNLITKKLPSTRCSTNKALPKLDPDFNPCQIFDPKEDSEVLSKPVEPVIKQRTYSYVPPEPPRIPKHYIDDE